MVPPVLFEYHDLNVVVIDQRRFDTRRGGESADAPAYHDDARSTTTTTTTSDRDGGRGGGIAGGVGRGVITVDGMRR
jgi:hypothetical protein